MGHIEENGSTRVSLATVLLLSLTVGLVVGFLDCAFVLFPSGHEVPPAAVLLAGLAVSTSILALSYLLVWWMAVAWLGRALRLQALPLAAALALGIALSFLLALIGDLVHFLSLTPLDLFKLLFVVLVSLFAAVAFYRAQAGFAGAAGLLPWLALPLVLGQTAAFLWINDSVLSGSFSIGTVLLALAFLVSALFTIRWVSRRQRAGRVAAVVGALAAAVFLSPFIAWQMISEDGSVPVGVGQPGKAIDHVILISVDTLRADAVSAYSPAAPSTPHIDSLAKDGILFRRAYTAAPWTLPSVTSIMTGVSPHVHLATKFFTRRPDALPTLADRFREAGYLTGAVVSNPFLHTDYNLGQGFATYSYYPRPHGESFGGRVLLRLFPDHFDPTAAGLTHEASAWLAANRERSFFFWVHYFDPHDPYDPPSAFAPPGGAPQAAGPIPHKAGPTDYVPGPADREWLRRLYRGEVRYVDDSIGRLLDRLKEMGLYDDALIIFTSDHGEEFWEHGGSTHGYTLFNEVLHVPLLVKLPRAVVAGATVDVPLDNASLFPTILELCRMEPDPTRLSYHSFAPLLAQPPAGYEPEPIVSTGLYSLLQEDSESVLFDHFKYIRSYLTGQERLFNLEKDPEERFSVYVAAPGEVERARTLLAAEADQAKRLKALYGISQPGRFQPSPELFERLRALGYVQ